MKKLLISLGVVTMMFFAQAADVNAATCDQKAEAICKNFNINYIPLTCCQNITCNNTSAADKATMCNKYCNDGNRVDASDCGQ